MKETIRIPNTNFSKAVNLISLLFLIGMILDIIIFWRTIPDQIPGHYNSMGEVDRWGGKGELFFLPVASILLYAGITALEKHPDLWNTGVTITPKNKDRVYLLLKHMIGFLKLLMVSLFTYLSFCTVHLLPLYRHFTEIALTAVFGSMAFYLIRIVRTPK